MTFARIIRTYRAAKSTAYVIHGRIRWYAHCVGPPQSVAGLKKSQEPVIGVQPSLKPTTYARMRPIHTGCAEMPIRTKTIEVLSSSERGRSADRIPTGNAISIHSTAPPITSDAVTGAAFITVAFTLCRLMYDLPRSR